MQQTLAFDCGCARRQRNTSTLPVANVVLYDDFEPNDKLVRLVTALNM
jgi:hypothetical protein